MSAPVGEPPSSPKPLPRSKATPTTSERLRASDMAATLARALREGVIGPDDTTVVFYDLARLDAILDELAAAFPPTTLHAVPVKANPLVEVLKRIRHRGHGAEVASPGELQLALAAGFPADAIVFDSPVKTREELELALRTGIGINANTLSELARIDGIYTLLNSRSRVGIRINPEIGGGAIDSTSVAGQHSKFGVSLRECRADLARALSLYPWLTGLHLHIGSQGMSSRQLLEGVGAVYDFFVESRRKATINLFNIGGGLPARYRESDQSIHFTEYANALRHRCPALFEPGVSLVTEFGRSIHASCGWVASKIEYAVEHDAGKSTIMVHVGGDMFLRKAYRPDDWHHDISVCDSTGQIRSEPKKFFDIAGPLCFAGDYVGRNVSLPRTVTEDDFLLIHDAGSYTFSMWSTYNSRQFPLILGYRSSSGDFQSLRKRQQIEDIINFWSPGERQIGRHNRSNSRHETTWHAQGTHNDVK